MKSFSFGGAVRLLLALTVCALGLVAAVACGEASATSPTTPAPVDQTFKVGDSVTLKLQFEPFTALVVRPGEAGVVRFSGTQSEGIEVLFEQKDSTITGKAKARGKSAEKGLRLALSVPPKANLEVSGPKVDLDLRAVSGAHVINSGEGDLVISGLEGKLNIQTQRGAVRARGIRGEVKIEAGSGSVSLRDVNLAKLVASTDTGPISLEGSSLAMELKTGSGAIYLSRSRSDRLDITTGNGLVAILGFEGALRATMKDGTFTAIDVKASEVAVSSGAGGVHLDRITGNLNLTTGTGDIQVLRAQEVQAVAKTASGSITLEGSLAKGSLSILEAAERGNVQVAIPSDSNVRVRAQSQSGEVRNSLRGDFPLRKARYVEGVMGTWDASLDALTSAGAITLEYQEATR